MIILRWRKFLKLLEIIMLRVFVVFTTLFVCIFSIEAKASNMGYIWFSKQGYYDRINPLDNPEILIFMDNRDTPKVNSIINIPSGNFIFSGLDIVQKVNDYITAMQEGKKPMCSRGGLGWGAWFFMDEGRNNEKCGLKSIGIEDDHRGYFTLFSQKRARVLGYVTFSTGLSFILVEFI